MLNTNDRIVKHKVGLLNLADELGNISKACKMMGVSRDTFYRYKEAVDDGGVESLFDKNRRVPNPKNRVDLNIETAVIQYAIDEPAHGQVRVSNELRRKGIFVSASGVRSVWLRHDLANFKLRLKALEAKVAEDGIILTESQVQALERKQQDDEACGEIDTVHPGYLGSQDTFYVGHFKGVGRVYQPTYVDTAVSLTANSTQRKHRLPQQICSMIACCLSMLRMTCLCYVFLQIEAQSIVVKQKVTITSFIWRSTTSSIREPKHDIRKQTASVSASIKPFYRSFISRLCDVESMNQ